MKRALFHAVALVALILAGLAWLSPLMTGQSTGQPSTKNGEWPAYTADVRGSKYSPLDQIDASNFNKLEVAWRFKTDNLGPRPEFKLEGTPLMVKGVLYVTAGTRRSVIALDARTGELIWAHSVREGRRAAIAPRQLSGRGVSYWTDGKGDDRVLYVTTGYRLVALNARNGATIPSFGKDGMVDLKEGAVTGVNTQIDLETGEIGIHATPTVAKDVVIVGSSFKEGTQPVTHNNTKGLVRAFDVRTGKKLWTFNTIPGPGEFGNDTWLKDSWATNGNTGVWTQITVDEQLGLVYLPVESPTSDFYGGHRPGNNLFGESLVCVDLKTGERKWHFQLVHHPLWDMDISSAPILADITVDGKPVKAVAQPSKQGFLYVFDRITGKPVWPMPEKSVEVGNVPGESYSPTQPIPSKPPAYSRNGVSVDDLIDFTPALHDRAKEIAAKYHLGPVFTPPTASKLDGPLGTLSIGTASGGTNWPGGSYDPETHVAYLYACNSCVEPIGLVAAPKEVSDIAYIAGTAGHEVSILRGPGENAGADSPKPSKKRAGSEYVPMNVDGLPLMKPPYGTISAINLDTGEIVWQIAHGETPDVVRNYPALKSLTIPRTGQETYNIGTLITKTLVIAGEGHITTTADHPRGAMLRAYDKKNGKEVGAVFMPAPQTGSPMTYMHNGKQYIVVAVSGGPYSGEYIAYALPSESE